MEWLKENGFGGAMVYAIDMDDFGGRCGAGKYPLLNTIKTELDGYKVDLEYDGPYESYSPNGKYTTKDRKFENILIIISLITKFFSKRSDMWRTRWSHQLPS